MVIELAQHAAQKLAAAIRAVAPRGAWVDAVQKPCTHCQIPTYCRVGDKAIHWGHLRGAAPAARADDQVANVQRLCSERLELELTDRQAAAVLDRWHKATGGLTFSSGWPGEIGVTAYQWLRGRSGAEARGISGIEPLSPESAALVDAFSTDLVRHPDYCDPAQPLVVGQTLTELDVNGQYLSAAGCELGTGDPMLVRAPRSVAGYLGLPGYLRLASDHRYDHPAFAGRLDAGAVIATTTATRLVRQGLELDVAEALIWTAHRRHLAAWQATFRDARAALAALAPTDRAAAIALDILKAVVTTTLGGWIRTPNNHRMYSKQWSDSIMAEGAVRQIIAADGGTLRPVGSRRDALWYATPEPPVPVDGRLFGLTISGQLGKFKIARTVPVTEEMVDAHAEGSPERLVRLIKAAWDTQRLTRECEG